MLMANLTINATAFDDTPDVDQEDVEPGSELGAVTDDAAARLNSPKALKGARNASGDGTAASDPSSIAAATRPFTVLGHWERATLLDLGGLSGKIQVNISSDASAGPQAPDVVPGPGQASGVTLGRMAVSGLAPADPADATTQPALTNMTSSLYFFRCARCFSGFAAG